MKVRRAVALGAVTVLFAVAGTLLFARADSKDSSVNLRLDAAFTILIGSTCRLEQETAAGNLATAKNVFWNEVHISSHALSAQLASVEVDRQAAILAAKSRVEVGFATLAPSLKTDVPTFGNEVRAGLRALAIPGAERAC